MLIERIGEATLYLGEAGEDGADGGAQRGGLPGREAHLGHPAGGQRECFHWSNLQPLWANENLKKGSKYVIVSQFSQDGGERLRVIEGGKR